MSAQRTKNEQPTAEHDVVNGVARVRACAVVLKKISLFTAGSHPVDLACYTVVVMTTNK